VIGLSKKNKNQINSNIVGCACYHGNFDMLKQLSKSLGKDSLNIRATEFPDFYASKIGGPLRKEVSSFTPLMLYCQRSDDNVDGFKQLLNFMDYTVSDENGNNILHIAAMSSNNKMVDYISKNLKIGIFDRNKNGESALSICE